MDDGNVRDQDFSKQEYPQSELSLSPVLPKDTNEGSNRVPIVFAVIIVIVLAIAAITIGLLTSRGSRTDDSVSTTSESQDWDYKTTMEELAKIWNYEARDNTDFTYREGPANATGVVSPNIFGARGYNHLAIFPEKTADGVPEGLVIVTLFPQKGCMSDDNIPIPYCDPSPSEKTQSLYRAIRASFIHDWKFDVKNNEDSGYGKVLVVANNKTSCNIMMVDAQFGAYIEIACVDVGLIIGQLEETEPFSVALLSSLPDSAGSVLTSPGIRDSSIEGYQSAYLSYCVGSAGCVSALFYRVGSGDWQFFAMEQQAIGCEMFDTDDKRRAFADYMCDSEQSGSPVIRVGEYYGLFN
ncbi:hypothetical protein FWH09_01125 [Candidatus Saccharibacteria bacterium]|nr:hypothetical protein [Candidatus Saccharibacteria bacterium]